MRLAARFEFRTTLDQAGRIAGLAGEVGTSESHVLRMLIDRALEGSARDLRRDLKQRQRAELEATAREMQDQGVDVDADDLTEKATP